MFSVDNSNNNTPTLLNQNNRFGVTFSGNYMKQSKVGYAHGSVVNIYIYIVYELKNRRISNLDFTVQNALFGAVKITKDVDTSNYKYSGYGICFDGKSDFTFGNNINGKNVIMFGCDMSFSSHANNKVNNIYVLEKDFVLGINGTTIYAEDIYKHKFTKPNKKFVLSLHYNDDDSYLFVNGSQELKFEAKNSEIQKNLLCLGNLSSDSSLTE